MECSKPFICYSNIIYLLGIAIDLGQDLKTDLYLELQDFPHQARRILIQKMMMLGV